MFAAAARRASRCAAVAATSSIRHLLGATPAPASPFRTAAAHRFSSTPPPTLTPNQQALYNRILEHDAAQAKVAKLLQAQSARISESVGKSAEQIQKGTSAAQEAVESSTGVTVSMLGPLMVASLALLYAYVRGTDKEALARQQKASEDEKTAISRRESAYKEKAMLEEKAAKFAEELREASQPKK